ncbi:hypothetical protein RQP46_003740 [Phenoliferia psychrophenolica]
MHLSESLDTNPAPPPTTIDSLPNETLNRIFELVAEPIALRAGWDLARAAVDSLLAASLVSQHWHELAGRVLDQNICIRVPITSDQSRSYTSRTRIPATNMILKLRLDSTGEITPTVGATQGLAHFRGVKSLHLESNSWLLLPSVGMEFLSFEDANILGIEVRIVTITTNANKPLHWSSDGQVGLAGFQAIEALKIYLHHTYHPSMWILSQAMFNQTIATLPPTSRLSQLSLPTGKHSSLDSITPFLNEPVLHNLKKFLLPNISRTLLHQRGFGRKLLAACEKRGIRVVFQEELELQKVLS